MKTTTSGFDEVWGNVRARKAVYKITYKRRYWNGAAYVLESAPKTIYRKEIADISGLSWSLDIPFALGIKSSNITISLKDPGYKWLPTNTASGVWRKDATATVGYDPYGSEFTIYYGYQLADETEEFLAIFTGRIVDDPKFDSKTNKATLVLVALAESKLENADAQKVTTTLTDQATDPATGNGTNPTFSTQKAGLWQASNVRAAAVVQLQGSEYKLDDLNDGDTEAAIVFESGAIPAGGETILYDGRQWHQNKSISELVGLLCDEAGIASANRQIEEPIYAAVDQSSTLTSEAQWAAGTGTNFESSSLPGTLRRKWYKLDLFTDGDITASPVWTIRDNSGPTNTASAATNAFVVTHSTPYTFPNLSSFYLWDTPLDKPSRGTWSFNLKSDSTFDGSERESHVRFISDRPYGVGGAARGYGVVADWNFNRWALHYYDGTTSSGTSIGTIQSTLDASDHDFMVTRDSNGTFKVYMDTVLKLTVTDASVNYEAGGYFAIAQKRTTPNPDTVASITTTVDNIYFAYSVETADSPTDADLVWTSDEIDMLAAPSLYLPLVVSHRLNSGTITYKTRTAAVSGGPYDAAVAVDGTLVPQSTSKRYFKLVVETTRAAGTPLAPEVDQVVVNWRGTNLFVASADFTGLNCLNAIAELAKMGNMEYGSKGDGTFFFRKKTVAAVSDITLTQKNALISIEDWKPGYREVRNVGQVRYGRSGSGGYYYAEYKASDAGEASPTTAARFGEKPIPLDLQRFNFSNSATAASAIARKLYEENYRPKRRIKVRSRIIPQLDLSDRATISFHDSPLIDKNILGDPFQKYAPMGKNPKTLARDILMKVVGHSPSVMRGESVIDLEEVL